MSALRLSSTCLLVLAVTLLGCHKPKAKQKERKQKAPAHSYKLGDTISFARQGTAERFKDTGWGDAEEDWTWTNAHAARLIFEIAENVNRPLRLRMKLLAFRNEPWLPAQHVEVIVNNETVADWQVGDLAEYVAVIPAKTADHEKLIIELFLPDAGSPKVLKIGEDPRVLGVCCLEAAIEAVDDATAERAAEEWRRFSDQAHGQDYTLGTVVRFGTGGAAQRFKGSGWHEAERDFTWTAKQVAVLEMAVAPTTRPLRLKVKLGGMVSADVPVQPAEVRVNGQTVAKWQVGAPADFEAIIPPEVVARAEKLKIELRPERPVSPAEADTGFDARVLGLRCEALILTEVE